MKNIKYMLFAIFSMFVFGTVVFAAPSYSFSVSTSNVENGKSVTASVTVKNTAAWNIKIISSGSTYGCNNSWADATSNGNNTTKTFSTTCKASSLGTISFTLSGDITSADGSNSNVSGSKSVQVVEPRPASTVNTLKSLSVEGYELTPAFDENTLEYSVEVPSTVNSVKINASKKDSRSSVSGDGEKEVSEGLNRFDIVVKAESGAEKTYVVVVNVKDNNPIEVKVGDKTYSVVKNSKYLEIPEGYVEGKVTINGVEVPSFTNEANNLTLVALKDETGNTFFFIYDDGKYTKFVELNGVSLNIMPLSIDEVRFKGLNKATITIDGNEIDALSYNDNKNYYILYAMNLSDGKSSYYIYDQKNNSYIEFDENLFNELTKSDNTYMYAFCASLGVIFLCIIIIIVQSKSRAKIIKRIREKEELLNSNKKKKNKEKEEEK